MSVRRLKRAVQLGAFAATNLALMARFRDRVGWKMAFLEDNLMEGILVGRGKRGQQQRIKAAAIQEAQALMNNEKDRLMAARTMIGPRGGLPTLKNDLQRLALLLNVEVNPKDTVVLLQEKIRPMVETLKRFKRLEPKSKTAPKATSHPSKTQTSLAESRTSSWSKPSTPMDQQLDDEGLGSQVAASAGRSGGSVQHHDAAGDGIGSTWTSAPTDASDGSGCGDDADPWRVSGRIKPGVRQMIAQAWGKHRLEQKLISCDKQQVRQILLTSWEKEMNDCMNEVFSFEFVFPNILATEVFTDTEPIARSVRRRGLHAGDSLTLSAGWDFRRPADRAKALDLIRRRKPYVVMLAFPCGPLMFLNPASDLAVKREEGLAPIRFAIQIAKLQVQSGRRFVMENPRPSQAWKTDELELFLQESFALKVTVDMCYLNLRGPNGLHHRKRTQLATSMQAVVSNLLHCQCPVIISMRL